MRLGLYWETESITGPQSLDGKAGAGWGDCEVFDNRQLRRMAEFHRGL